MEENKLIFNSVDLNVIELIQDDHEYSDEAFSSISLNPLVSWIKFILTDDQPNANKQRIPLEEFSNLIKTGIFMPIKMASGEIKDGHDESLPLGVITHLKEDGNQIRGIAALWSRERPLDVDLIKKMFKEGKKPQLSWEIAFSSSNILDGIEILKDTALKAATFVGMPAYSGRTPVIAVANKKNNEEDAALEEIEQLKTKVSELEAKLAETEKLLTEKDAEITPLREFKASVEEAQKKEEKLASIKAKFTEAGITKEEDYFETNKETLLSLDEAALDFMIQELVSFSSQDTVASAKVKEVKVPRIVSDKDNPVDLKDIATALRERNAKK
jgi:hypothetical protein